MRTIAVQADLTRPGHSAHLMRTPGEWWRTVNYPINALMRSTSAGVTGL
jgi:hypothetical protein